MSWIDKILPPRIKREEGTARKVVPEGLWTKCPGCEAVLYSAELEKTQMVCPKCAHHLRIGARARLDALMDAEGRYEIGQEVLPVDALKFKDSRKYTERLQEAMEQTGETDALVVMGGAIRALPVVVACFEFEFMGGSMGSVVGERFVRGVATAIEQKVPFICITSTGGARMQEGLLSLFQMAKTTAMIARISRLRSSTRCEMNVSCGSGASAIGSCTRRVAAGQILSKPGRLAWRAGGSDSAAGVAAAAGACAAASAGEGKDAAPASAGPNADRSRSTSRAPVSKSRTAELTELSSSRAAPCTCCWSFFSSSSSISRLMSALTSFT